jgi:hypothetical protein
MTRIELNQTTAISRRRFVGGAAVALSASMVPTSLSMADETGLALKASGQQYAFDTGPLRGVLRSEGRSLGLMPVSETVGKTPIARGHGLFSHYRLLDAENRYGHGAWDWASEAQVVAGGAVRASWSADEAHPFDLSAEYRWSDANTFDVTTSVVAKRDLRRMEVFLASYFEGFPKSFAYVRGCPETDGKPGFLEALPSYGLWQMFPRDAEAVAVVSDGRWQHPPSPVQWKIMPQLAAPLAIRRDPDRKLTALVMAPPEDCFAIATPCNEEGHRSLYLSLIGRDLKADQRVSARSRLVIGSGISDQQAIALYEEYVKGA